MEWASESIKCSWLVSSSTGLKAFRYFFLLKYWNILLIFHILGVILYWHLCHTHFGVNDTYIFYIFATFGFMANYTYVMWIYVKAPEQANFRFFLWNSYPILKVYVLNMKITSQWLNTFWKHFVRLRSALKMALKLNILKQKNTN